MCRRKEITNGESIIDSREVIARIEYLEGLYEQAKESAKELTPDDFDAGVVWTADDGTALDESFLGEDEYRELTALRNLAAEASASPDWVYGEVLISDDYFVEYAQDFAENCGYVLRKASWPYTCIDWEAAADKLKADYTQVDFDGTTYWIRA